MLGMEVELTCANSSAVSSSGKLTLTHADNQGGWIIDDCLLQSLNGQATGTLRTTRAAKIWLVLSSAIIDRETV
ncbi:MAG: hypothetical protein ACTSV6_07360 [Candidatus Heimdallarchaeota archaeon]